MNVSVYVYVYVPDPLRVWVSGYDMDMYGYATTTTKSPNSFENRPRHHLPLEVRKKAVEFRLALASSVAWRLSWPYSSGSSKAEDAESEVGGTEGAAGDAERAVDEMPEANGAPNGEVAERTVDEMPEASGAPSGLREVTNVETSPSSEGSRLCLSDLRCRSPSDSGSGNPSSWLFGTPRVWMAG